MKMNRLAAPAAMTVVLLATSLTLAETASTVEATHQIRRDALLLSSDEFGGRGLGSPELERAARYLRDRFAELGLKTDMVDGDALQRFEVTTTTKRGEDNHASFVSVKDVATADRGTADRATADGPGQPVLTVLKLDEDYTPMAIGGAGDFSLPVAFVGYGITAPEANYDDYADIDVTGKAVIILRHEPEQANPDSKFNGAEPSRHAPFTAKVSNAVQHGAAAVLFTTDAYEIDQRAAQWEKRIATAEQDLAEAATQQPANLRRRIERFKTQLATERDPLLGFRRAGQSSDRDLPVLSVRPSVIDQLLAQAGRPTLRELETQIDGTLKPASFDLAEAQLVGKADIRRERASVANVIGVLPGAGPHADELVIIGAHYDHIGRGGSGSGKPGSNEIHNGADDNASGVAGMLAIARQLAERDEPLDRTVVFIGFTAEETGLLGSAHYAKQPLYPLDATVAMLNLDMVGRMRGNELIINGVGTAEEFAAVVESANQTAGFSLTTTVGGFGPSDHASFYAKQIPVLHFFTGLHDDYHKPADDFELLNLRGVQRISAMVADVATRIANGETTVTYAETNGPSMPQGKTERKTDPRPYFGSIPDFASDGTGYAITGVAPGSPAAFGGLQGGDKIIQLGEHKISNLDDFDNALRKFIAGDKAQVVVVRAGTEVTLEVVLDPPK